MVKNGVCGGNVHSTALLIYYLNCQFCQLYDKLLSRGVLEVSAALAKSLCGTIYKSFNMQAAHLGVWLKTKCMWDKFQCYFTYKYTFSPVKPGVLIYIVIILF